MCVKLIFGDLNPDPSSRTSQALILIEKPPQECMVVIALMLLLSFFLMLAKGVQ